MAASDGHKLTLKVYDDQSSPSAVLSNARLAVEQGAQAIISNDVYFDTAGTYLKQQGIPVFGSGITPGFYGADKPMFFSQEGNWIGYESNAQSKYWSSPGPDQDRRRLRRQPGQLGRRPRRCQGGHGWPGASLLYTNYSVDDTNSASLLALAQRLSGDGRPGRCTPTSTAPRRPSSRPTCTRSDSKALVVAGSIGVSPAVPQQFGSTIDGLLSEVFSATWFNPQHPGHPDVHCGHEAVLPVQRAKRRGPRRVGQHGDVRRGDPAAREQRRRRRPTSSPPATRSPTTPATACSLRSPSRHAHQLNPASRWPRSWTVSGRSSPVTTPTRSCAGTPSRRPSARQFAEAGDRRIAPPRAPARRPCRIDDT